MKKQTDTSENFVDEVYKERDLNEEKDRQRTILGIVFLVLLSLTLIWVVPELSKSIEERNVNIDWQTMSSYCSIPINNTTRCSWDDKSECFFKISTNSGELSLIHCYENIQVKLTPTDKIDNSTVADIETRLYTCKDVNVWFQRDCIDEIGRFEFSPRCATWEGKTFWSGLVLKNYDNAIGMVSDYNKEVIEIDLNDMLLNPFKDCNEFVGEKQTKLVCPVKFTDKTTKEKEQFNLSLIFLNEAKPMLFYDIFSIRKECDWS